MRTHLHKAREVYEDEGLLQIIKSTVRYAPIEMNNFVFWLRHGTGTRVMKEDWDNLLILDGCRHGMFSDQIDIDGRLESRVSLGSSSEEFLEQNFNVGKFHDTVYVNANPYIPRLGLDNGTFHAVVDCLEEWDRELQTVRPETVANTARRAHDQYPDKRLIVHFMQPHAPFIGEQGVSLIGGGWTMDHEVENEEQSIWDYLRDHKTNLDINEFWTAYKENLDVALDEVKPLLDILSGKSVITADHGNLVGERLSPIPTRRKYGHPYGVHAEELLKVPWFIPESQGRRETRADPPEGLEGISDGEVENRLTALGYK